MADFRSVQTRMWREDVWFEQLPDNDARLLWVYLFTNPSSPMTGLYRLTLRSIANETYITQERASELLEMFAWDGKAYYDQERGVIFVVNMQRLQFENVSPNMARRMQKDIDAIPDCELKQTYLTKYGYPVIVEHMDGSKKREQVEYRYPWDDDKQGSDSLSIPYAYPIDRGATTETETSTKTKHQPNGKTHDDELVDHEIVEAVSKWQTVFAGTPFAIKPPVEKFYAWLAFGGPDVLYHMIEQARDKDNPTGWLWTTYDNWRKDGEVAPYIAQQVESKRAASAPAVPVKIGIIWPDGTTGEVETTKRV